MRVSRKISIYRAQRSQQGCSLSLGMLRLAEPPTGRARLRSSLKSPRNPIPPFETSRVATLHPGVLKRFLEDMRHRLSEKSAFTLHMLHVLRVLHMSDVSEEKDIRREIATVRCICNAGLQHCNGEMHLQPSVAPPHPVGARIARPFVPDVITAIFREGARRVIGATAKPLYPIGGKAVGLDRRSPRPPSSREVFGMENRRSAECRRARDARPYNAAGNCNCEMHLQRWVASLQR